VGDEVQSPRIGAFFVAHQAILGYASAATRNTVAVATPATSRRENRIFAVFLISSTPSVYHRFLYRIPAKLHKNH
jgi:hypothetical protein